MEDIIVEIQPSGSLSPVPNSVVITWPSQQMSLTWGKEKGNLIYLGVLGRACQMCRQQTAVEKVKESKHIVETNSPPPFPTKSSRLPLDSKGIFLYSISNYM